MEITRTSALTGIKRTRELPVSEAQLTMLALHGAKNVHHIFPDLSPFDREFIVAGIMPSEWNQQAQQVA